MKRTELPFWMITISILILLTVPKLIQDGMFLDGMLYTSVSHNLSHGIGSFWQPVASPFYNNSGSHFFHEHPPLAFGIQSLFYRLLGDSMYVERFYIFLTFCLTAFLIGYLWNLIFINEKDVKDLAWLPVLLWVFIPSTSWSYSNNMMENTMSLFDIIAVIFIYRAMRSEKNGFIFLFLSGLFVFCATMSKGVPGFFPLALPVLYWIIFRKGSFIKILLQTLIILVVPVVFFILLFNLPESGESLRFYINERLLQRIGSAPTVTTRFYIFLRLFNELLPLIILSAIIIFFIKYKKSDIPLFTGSRQSIFFFSTGLAASLPLALTMVQRGFYLVPSFPYFALGFAILLAPAVVRIRAGIISDDRKLMISKITGIALVIIAISFSVMMKGKTVRDKDILHDIHLIGETIPEKSAITINQETATNYSLEYYFSRYYNIGLHIDVPEKYMMLRKVVDQADTVNYSKLNIDTRVYDFYQRK